MVSMKWLGAGTALGVMLCAAMPASAGLFVRKYTPEEQAFVDCDGYAPAGRNGDGIVTTSAFLGLGTMTADQRQGKVSTGIASALACDTALASALLQPQYALRRAHLLQAKAIHQISAGKLEEALATIRLSNSAGAVEPFFDRSLGQGNRALSAVALSGLKRNAEAEAALAEIEAKRPFATSQMQMAMRVRLQFADDRKQQVSHMATMAQTFPALRKVLFDMALADGRFAEALQIAPTIVYDDPSHSGGYTIASESLEPYYDRGRRIDLKGAQAYALLALGRDEEAARMYNAARSDHVELIKEPALGPEGEPPSKKIRRDYEMRKTIGGVVEKRLDMWKFAMGLRKDAPTLTLEQLKTEAKKSPMAVPVMGDIIGHAKIDGPADMRLQSDLLDALAKLNAASDANDWRMEFADLIKMMPRPESSSQQVRFKNDGIIFSSDDGYAVKPDKTQPGRATVRFGTGKGTVAMADEGALYAAADYAVKNGRPGFVVEARTAAQRTLIYNGVPQNKGYEVDLLVRLANPGEAGVGANYLDAAKLIEKVKPNLLFVAG